MWISQLQFIAASAEDARIANSGTPLRASPDRDDSVG
jgi:hypothetical protein